MASKKVMVFLGADHHGVKEKEVIKQFLKKNKIPFEDLGSNSIGLVDYPVYAAKVAKKAVQKKGFGILMCLTGTGMTIAANKIRGARAVIAYDTFTDIMARRDNDANILVLRKHGMSMQKNLRIIRTFLSTPFSKIARYKRRINLLKKLEKSQ